MAAPERIVATHVGSLIRPPNLVEFLRAIEDGKPYDQAGYQACLKDSIAEIVRQQVEAGVDIVSDGEFSKGGNWAFYIHKRLSGVATRPLTPDEMKDPMASAGGGQDRKAFPEFYAEYDAATGLGKRLGNRFICNGPIKYTGQAEIARDIANLKSAAAAAKVDRRIPAGGRARERNARRKERTLQGREASSCSRSPTRCTRNTRRSPIPDSTCRSTTPSCPTCTRRWCRRCRRRNTASGRSCASMRSIMRCAAFPRNARATTSAGEAGTGRTPSTCP